MGNNRIVLATSNAQIEIQAALHRPWSQALENLAEVPGPPTGEGRHLLALLRAGYHLRHVACPEKLMQTILDDVVAVLRAQRGAIVLVDPSSGALTLRAAAVPGKGINPLRCFSRTLAQRCINRGESMLCQDVTHDAELHGAGSTMRHNMSSIICALLRSPRKQLGVLHLDRGPLAEPFNADDFMLADALAASVSAGIESAELVTRQSQMFLQTVTTLARAVELRDQYTGTHTQRVTEYALLLAGELEVPEDEAKTIEIGTPLHDIGKIGIADSLLRKAGRLTAEEFEVMKTHTVQGAKILETIPGLRPMISIVRHHHERWDGLGYPDGLAGPHISAPARIVAVADAFDAMITDRPYRPALPVRHAFTEIEAGTGTQFAPECVAAFMRLRPRIEKKLPPFSLCPGFTRH